MGCHDVLLVLLWCGRDPDHHALAPPAAPPADHCLEGDPAFSAVEAPLRPPLHLDPLLNARHAAAG